MIKKKEINKILEAKLKTKSAQALDNGEKIPRERRTEDEILKDRQDKILSVKTNPLIKPVIKMPFKIWADTQNLSELNLTESEEEDFTLQITRILEYYLPKKSPVTMMWLGFLGSLSSIMLPRMQLISKIKKDKKLQIDNANVRCPNCIDLIFENQQTLDEHLKSCPNKK